MSVRLVSWLGVWRPVWTCLWRQPHLVSHQLHDARNQRQKVRRILDRFLPSDPAISIPAFDDSELMSEFGPDRAHRVLRSANDFVFAYTSSDFWFRWFYRNTPGGFEVSGTFAFLNATLVSVIKKSLIFTANQPARVGNVILARVCQLQA